MNTPAPRTGDFIDPTDLGLGSIVDSDTAGSLVKLAGNDDRMRTSRGLVEAILSQLPVTLITVGLDGTIELVEGQALKRLGFRPEEMVGKNFFQLYRNHTHIVEGVRKGLAGESCTVACTHANYVFDVRVAPMTNEFQELTGIVALVVDATERHVTAKRLTDTNLRLQSIIHSLSDGVIVIKKDGCIEEVNPRAEEILGISREQLIGANPFGTNWNSIYDDGRPFPPEESPSMTALRTGIPQRDVVMGVRLCNRVLWLSINSEPMIREGETEPFAVVASISDISLRRELAEKERVTRDKLTHALRVNTLGEMATVLAHELNQPLTAIALLSSSMQALLPGLKGDGSNRLGEILQQVIDQSVRAGKVVRRMRALTRRTKTTLASCSLNGLVDEVMGLLDNDMSLQGIVWSCMAEFPQIKVLVDPIQTQQVLINLVRNGMDAMHDSPLEERWVKIEIGRLKDEAGMAYVSVVNSGRPIDPSIRDEIFEPYVSSKPDGLGLGLPICRTIVEMQDGKLWLVSSPNEPTEFKFTLKTVD